MELWATLTEFEKCNNYRRRPSGATVCINVVDRPVLLCSHCLANYVGGWLLCSCDPKLTNLQMKEARLVVLSRECAAQMEIRPSALEK